MKKTIFLIVFISFALAMFGQQAADLIIKDVTIIPISENKVITKQSIAITKGIITEITDFEKIIKSKATQIIDGKGKFVMPGLAEMHSHLPNLEKIDTFLIANVAAGVTRIRVMNSKEPVLKAKQLIATKSISPNLYYPYIFTRDITISSDSQVDSLMNAIKKDGYDFIKMFSVFDESLFDKLLKAANTDNITVCGHYPKNVKLDKVLESGFKSIEHLGGYDKLMSEPEIENAIQLTKKYATYNCPTLDWDITAYNLQLFTNYKNRLVFSNAPKHFIDGWNKDLEAYIKKEGEQKINERKDGYMPTFQRKTTLLKKLNDAGALLLLGSDAGGLYQMDGFNLYEEMLSWSAAGIGNYDILKAATLNPALFFKEEKKWGTVEKGKIADLIVLDKNPLEDLKNMQTVEITIIGGKVFTKSGLLKKI